MARRKKEPVLYEGLLRALYRKRIRYLVVGGVAVNFYGYQRFTKDIDLMLALDSKNVLRFIEAVRPLGYRPIVPVEMEQLAQASHRQHWIKKKGALVFHLQHLDRHYERIDVFIKNPFPFESAFKNRRDLKVRDFMIRLISYRDLVRLKKMAGRPQDELDLAVLEKITDQEKRNEEI